MQIEPIAMIAELIDNTDNTHAEGLVTLSPTPGELEFKGNVPRLSEGATVGLIVHTLNGILTSLVGTVSFYGRGIIGICDTEEEGMKKLRYLMSQNIVAKTYAVHSKGLLMRGEDYDISITRIEKELCCFTSIEDISVGSVLNINISSPLLLKNYRVTVEEKYSLRNRVNLYITKPIKVKAANQRQIDFFLSKVL